MEAWTLSDELIAEFQKKSIHIAHLGMKLGLGGS
jgi:hypothetical protein